MDDIFRAQPGLFADSNKIHEIIDKSNQITRQLTVYSEKKYILSIGQMSTSDTLSAYLYY